MQFSHITNAAFSEEPDRPLMQKEVYAVSFGLQQYLQQYQRDVALPFAYQDLLHYRYTIPIRDKNGRHTHWENVVYEKDQQQILKQQLAEMYKLLMNPADTNFEITAIDFCEYANSMPFRATVQDNTSGKTSVFYIKSADASRIYGLELEQLLSPNPIHFLYHQNTLVEQHISGTPGDDFLPEISQLTTLQKQQLAEEFICFNERSFARLLGDMRSYNFVVTNGNNANNPYRIRSIDFDQQCYEGRLNLYLPQFYRENVTYVQLAYWSFSSEQIEAIRQQERIRMAGHISKNEQRLQALLSAMLPEKLSEHYKVLSLRKELGDYFSSDEFSNCNTMGGLVKQQLHQISNW